ncbi:hypothetical protein MsAg5_00170 [Methanosarcinaceae archaeon Ag5]|uniref:DUF4325 domain-containing protein n=1 Tax=Methanolapillus africanus TaxID=3028297 RepID=A0AAE4MHQ2_9EURY|nr:hypothetical protein [Methanosarcinaceae archaeon Ag5]
MSASKSRNKEKIAKRENESKAVQIKKSQKMSQTIRKKSVTIKAKDFISMCFADSDADAIKTEINRALDEYERVTIDFSELGHFTTYFFNRAFTDRLEQMPVEEYDARIFAENLPQAGMSAYELAYMNAVEYFSLPPEGREAWNRACEKVNEEMGWI